MALENKVSSFLLHLELHLFFLLLLGRLLEGLEVVQLGIGEGGRVDLSNRQGSGVRVDIHSGFPDGENGFVDIDFH